MIRTLTAAAFASLTFLAPASLPAQQTNPLAAAYPIKVGDLAASSLSELLKLRSDFREPALVTYEPTAGTIDVEVFGRPTLAGKTDQARTVLGTYWEFIQAVHIPYVERRFKAKLTAQHYRLLYYDARTEGQPQLILQFVNGQYLIP